MRKVGPFAFLGALITFLFASMFPLWVGVGIEAYDFPRGVSTCGFEDNGVPDYDDCSFVTAATEGTFFIYVVSAHSLFAPNNVKQTLMVRLLIVTFIIKLVIGFVVLLRRSPGQPEKMFFVHTLTIAGALVFVSIAEVLLFSLGR